MRMNDTGFAVSALISRSICLNSGLIQTNEIKLMAALIWLNLIWSQIKQMAGNRALVKLMNIINRIIIRNS